MEGLRGLAGMMRRERKLWERRAWNVGERRGNLELAFRVAGHVWSWGGAWAVMHGKSIGRWSASWEFSSFAEPVEGRRKRAGRDDEEGRFGWEIGEGVKPRDLLHGSSMGDWLVERKRADLEVRRGGRWWRDQGLDGRVGDEGSAGKLSSRGIRGGG